LAEIADTYLTIGRPQQIPCWTPPRWLMT